MNNSTVDQKQLIVEGACLLERFAKAERAKGKTQLATAAERSAQAIRRCHGLQPIQHDPTGWTPPISLGCAIGGIPFSDALRAAARAERLPANV